MVETGFSYLRKNLRRTIMRVRENLGLRSEPLLPRLRTIREPHERGASSSEEVEKVEVCEREVGTEAEAEKPVEEAEGVEPQEDRTKEAREPSLRERTARTLIEDIIAYRRKHGLLSSVRRTFEAIAMALEAEAMRAQAQVQDQEARRREEALRQEVERLRQELKRLQGAHY